MEEFLDSNKKRPWHFKCIENKKEVYGRPITVDCVRELNPFLKKKIKSASGSTKIPLKIFKGNHLVRAQSWGKHLLLSFQNINLRIHFLMFGSYRIDNPRENRKPKLLLNYGDHKIYFYSCAIKEITDADLKKYDKSIDLMSTKWNPQKALKALQKKPSAQVCDLLMDQNIFAGLGNIMKNEILFNLLMHPETQVQDLKLSRLKKLVKESEDYAWQFYEWKKANALKRNWKIMRKKICPRCERKVIKKETGKLKRISHFCSNCQSRQ